MPIAPHRLDHAEYLSTRYRHFKDVEAAIPRVYTDNLGIPTVAIGYALLIRGSDKRYSLRQGWAKPMRDAGAAISDTQEGAANATFERIAGILNSGAGDAVAQAQAIIPPWSAGENSATMNKLDLPLLSDTEMEALFDGIIGDYQDILAGKIGADLVEAGADSLELIALLSLTYNNPSLIGPGLTAALKAGNRPEAWYQIRQNSNGSKSRGIAKRRYFEGHTFGLYNDIDNIGAEEAKGILAMYDSHKSFIDGYESALGEMVPAANRDYALSGSEIIPTLEEALAPARKAAG